MLPPHPRPPPPARPPPPTTHAHSNLHIPATHHHPSHKTPPQIPLSKVQDGSYKLLLIDFPPDRMPLHVTPPVHQSPMSPLPLCLCDRPVSITFSDTHSPSEPSSHGHHSNHVIPSIPLSPILEEGELLTPDKHASTISDNIASSVGISGKKSRNLKKNNRSPHTQHKPSDTSHLSPKLHPLDPRSPRVLSRLALISSQNSSQKELSKKSEAVVASDLFKNIRSWSITPLAVLLVLS